MEVSKRANTNNARRRYETEVPYISSRNKFTLVKATNLSLSPFCPAVLQFLAPQLFRSPPDLAWQRKQLRRTHGDSASLRSWRYCVEVEWNLAAYAARNRISNASSSLPFLDHGSAAKILTTHRDNTASYTGYSPAYLLHGPLLKVVPLFCTAHPLLRITLRHPRWRRFFPLARREQTRAAFAELKLLFAIIMRQIGWQLPGLLSKNKKMKEMCVIPKSAVVFHFAAVELWNY